MAKGWFAVALAIAYVIGATARTPTEPASDTLAEETTTSAPGFSAANLVSLLWDNIDDQLKSDKFQWVNGLVVLGFGKLMVWDGEASLKTCTIAGPAIMMYFFAMSQIHASHLEDQLGKLCSIVVSIEIACLFAMVLWYGYDAMKYCLGAVLGVVMLGWVVNSATYHYGEDFASNKWFLFISGNVCIVGGCFLLYEGSKEKGFEARNGCIKCVIRAHEATAGKFRKMLLTFLFAFLGGLLVSSSLSYFFGVLATLWPNNLKKWGITVSTASPRGGHWIDYFLTITSPDNPDVGIFQSLPKKGFPFAGSFYHLDCILGRVGWLLFTGLGVLIWYLRVKKEKKAAAKAAEEAKAAKDEEKGRVKSPSQPKQKAKAKATDSQRGNNTPPARQQESQPSKGFFASFRRGEKSQPLLG